MSNPSKTPARRYGLLATAGMIGILALCTLDSSFYTISQNERGFVRQFGKVENPADGLVTPGLHLKMPFITNVDRLSVSIDVMDLGNIDTYTRDAQKISLHITVTSQVPDAAVYHLLYEVGRAGNVDLEKNYATIIGDRLRTVIGRHDITEVAGADRQQIIDEARSVLSHDLAQLYGIHVDSLQIALVGMPPSYERAIEQAMKARTDRQAAEQIQQKAVIEANTAKVRATGDANAAIENARGASESRLLQAQAEAQAVRLKGQADADAALAVSKALTASPNLVALRTAERWNGQLPQNIYAGAPLPFLQVPGTETARR